VFALTILLALPLALTMRGMLRTHLGSSLAVETAADGVNYDWWQEFTSQASGIGTTFLPTILGFAATLDTISSVLDGERPIVEIAVAIAIYLVGWLFLVGGIIDRYARQRPTRAYGFFAASGMHVFRLLRLGIAQGIVYWCLFNYLHRWLFREWYVARIRDLADERLAFAWQVGLYAAFFLLVILVNTLFDYATIRIVVEDRRSALGALSAAARFMRHRLGRAIGLYAINGVTFIALIGVWALIAPGAGGAGLSVWLAFLLGQLYVLARLMVKLQFLASQTSLFQASLAHATYTAAPEPTWPDSPAAEMIVHRT